jgi:hypothetical protein
MRFNTSTARQNDATLVKRSGGSIDARTVANALCRNHITSPVYHPSRRSAFVLPSHGLEARPLESTCRRAEKCCQPKWDSKGPLTNGNRCVYVGSGVGSREATLGAFMRFFRTTEVLVAVGHRRDRLKEVSALRRAESLFLLSGSDLDALTSTSGPRSCVVGAPGRNAALANASSTSGLPSVSVVHDCTTRSNLQPCLHVGVADNDQN